MTELKGKKSSLLFWRGLVVFGILALAFAFAGCSSGSSNDNGGLPPNGGDGGGNGPNGGNGLQPARYVTRITLLNAGDIGFRINWQGLAPDITGAILDVEWSDDTRENVVVTDANRNQWGTFPPNVNSPATSGDTSDRETFQIVHRSSSLAGSAGFWLHNIIPLTDLVAIAPPNFVWYADQRPDFAGGVTLAGSWSHYVFASPTNAAIRGRVPGQDPIDGRTYDEWVAATSTNLAWMAPATRTDFIPFSVGYPLVDFGNVFQVPRRVYVVVGDGTGNRIQSHINVANFLEPIEVGFLSANTSNNFFLRDDHFVGLGENQIRDVLYALLTAETGNIFRIYYGNGVQRDINWQEFRANRQWHRALFQANAPAQDLQAYRQQLLPHFGQRIIREGNWEHDVLIMAADETWNFTVDYVGVMAGGTVDVDGTHRVHVNPDVPVYSFVSFAPNPLRRVGIHQNLQIQQHDTDRPASISDVPGLLIGIRERWQLFGTYARGGTQRELQMNFVFPMFDNVPTPEAGMPAFTVASRSNWWAPGVPAVAAWPQDWWGPANPPMSVYRDWGLPIEWRRNARISAADGIPINVISYSGAARIANGYVETFRIAMPGWAAFGQALTGAALTTDFPTSLTDLNDSIRTASPGAWPAVTAANVWPDGMTVVVAPASPIPDFTSDVSTNADLTLTPPRPAEIILQFSGGTGNDWAFSENLTVGTAITTTFPAAPHGWAGTIAATGRRVASSSDPGGDEGGNLYVHLILPLPAAP